MACGIYCIENLVNGKKYIGQSTRIETRWISHKSDMKRNKENIYLQSSYNKHGINSFSFYIIEECQKDFLDDREIYWILFHESNKRESGYNLTNGGNKPPSWQGKHHSDETKEKIGKASKGNKHWLGKKHSEETKKKIANKTKGRIVSEETRIKISIANKGKEASFKEKKHSDSTKEKMSIVKRGKKQSPELIEKRISKIRGIKRTKEQSILSSFSRQGVKLSTPNRTSIYIGVSFKQRDKKWIAQISFKNKKIWIGGFLLEIDAAKAYDKKATELYGNNCKRNFV